MNQIDAETAAILGNLVHFLLADGHIDEREIDLLRQVAARHGAVMTADISEWRRLAENPTVRSTTDPDLARHCLAECFAMMTVDEEVHEAERRAWIQLAIWLGASPAESRATLKTLESNSICSKRNSLDIQEAIIRAIRQGLPSLEILS